ncbi:MAG: HEAT repeat domain-containing protein [Lentisphaerota bacterium]
MVPVGQTIESLTEELRSPNALIRKAAVMALIQTNDPRRVMPLIEVLQGDDGAVKNVARLALDAITDPAALPYFIEALNAYTNFGCRVPALLAMGRYKDPSIASNLLPFLSCESEPLRALALKAFTQIEDPALLDPLISLLDNPDNLVRRQAVQSIIKIDDPRRIAPLIKAMRDQDPVVLERARRAVDVITDPATLPYFIAALNAYTNFSCQVPCLLALGRIRDPGSVSNLVPFLNNKQEKLRFLAIQALAQIKDPSAVDSLIGISQDPSSVIRLQVINALGEIRGPRVIETLIARLDDSDDAVRIRAIRALTQITGKQMDANPKVWKAWWLREQSGMDPKHRSQRRFLIPLKIAALAVLAFVVAFKKKPILATLIYTLFVFLLGAGFKLSGASLMTSCSGALIGSGVYFFLLDYFGDSRWIWWIVLLAGFALGFQ